MHELAITENIIRISEEEAKKHNAVKVNLISIKMGSLSDLVSECIQMYFDIASKNTLVEGAILKIEKLPISVICNSCGKKSEVYKAQFNCTHCGSNNIKIMGGNEFYIDSLEVE